MIPGAFADERLLRTGRCHETEIYSAFRKSHAKYRNTVRPPVTPSYPNPNLLLREQGFPTALLCSQEAVSDRVLRDMVKQWFPAAQRTGSGYYKNVSVAAAMDPFQ